MKLLLFSLCIAELLLITFLQNVAGPFVSPVLLLLTSAAIAFIYWKRGSGAGGKADVVSQKTFRWARFAQVFAFGAISLYLFYVLTRSWSVAGISVGNTSSSDIIPQIMTLTRRLRAGKMPYVKMNFLGYELFPTYLPLQWMPYWLAESGGFDYRWIAAVALWLACLYYFITSAKFRQPVPGSILASILPLWPLAAWTAMVINDSYTFSVSVESLVASYYLFTAMRTGENKVLPFAIGIAFCLLSRYSIILWAPLCLFIYFASGRRRQGVIIFSVITICFLVFYWYPFLRRDSQIFLNGYTYHTKAAMDIWYRKNSGLSNGLAFDTWFMRLAPGEKGQQLHANQLTHAVVCGLAIIAMAIYYWLNKNSLQLKSYLLFSLKVYITLFYSFIQLPFTYLYIVPVMISAALLRDAILPRTQLQP